VSTGEKWQAEELCREPWEDSNRDWTCFKLGFLKVSHGLLGGEMTQGGGGRVQGPALPQPGWPKTAPAAHWDWASGDGESGWILERSDVSGAAWERVARVEHSPKFFVLSTQKNRTAEFEGKAGFRVRSGNLCCPAVEVSRGPGIADVQGHSPDTLSQQGLGITFRRKESYGLSQGWVALRGCEDRLVAPGALGGSQVA